MHSFDIDPWKRWLIRNFFVSDIGRKLTLIGIVKDEPFPKALATNTVV